MGKKNALAINNKAFILYYIAYTLANANVMCCLCNVMRAILAFIFRIFSEQPASEDVE